MKKLIIFLLLSTAFSWLASAKQVEENTARTVAGKFFVSHIGMNQIQPLPAPVLVFTSNDLKPDQDGGAKTAPDFYVFNFTHPAGFVIVSGNDACTPILGYSTEGSFATENMHPGLSWLLESYTRQISDVAGRQLKIAPEIAAEWAELLSDSPVLSGPQKATNVVGPLLTLKWAQSPKYNNMCPKSATDTLTVTGCVAASMAMVMKYHNYPDKGVGENSYTTETLKLPCSANFGNTTYRWDLMPDSLARIGAVDSISAVATLMYHCGVSININYGVKETSGGNFAWGDPNYPCTENALKKYFKYNPSLAGDSSNGHSDEEWKAKLRRDLVETLPVIYEGGNDNGKGHSYVCDGYDDQDRFHFNWGWGGSENGWFLLSAVKSKGEKVVKDQNAIFRIRKFPEGINDPITSGGLIVYPNPAKDEIFMKGASGELTVGKCVISTLDGRQFLTMLPVKQNENYRIPVSSLTNGLYMMTVITGNGPVTRKIMINR